MIYLTNIFVTNSRKENRLDKFRVFELKTGAFELYKSYLNREKRLPQFISQLSSSSFSALRRQSRRYFDKTNNYVKYQIKIPKKMNDFNHINFLYNLRLE